MLWLTGVDVYAQASEPAQCAPQITSIASARATGPDGARPTDGWVPVTLPDGWGRRWPQFNGSGWYRIDWERRGCAANEPVALGIDGISTAGEVFVNNDLLWRDESLVEPLSRSWNVPRWWLLPESALHDGVNTIWVRAVGYVALSAGMGSLRLGSPHDVAAAYRGALWHQKTIYFINAVLAAMAAVLFLLAGLLRPGDSAYRWFGLMALGWLVYLTTFLADSSWPFPDAMSRSRFSSIALIWYTLCACMFTFRFGGQRLPWVERSLWGLAAAGVIAILLAPLADVGRWFTWVWQGTMAVFLANCIQFQWHAWRPRAGERIRKHMLLAMVWLAFVVIAVHDLSGMWGLWEVARSWAAVSGLLIITLLMLVLGGQLITQIRSVEHFNRDLALAISNARSELAHALEREHTQALSNAKLQERMQIAHDLHDGLGASLVRSMALVEQAEQPLPNERLLSLLKTLRDDLRQVIDSSAVGSVSVPETPVQWIAPIRHRFTRIFDELDIDSRWQVASAWSGNTHRPTALQCLVLARLLEEALSNILKHSQARRVLVDVQQPSVDRMQVSIEDDGVGFDVQAVQQSGLSVGMRSMTARAERLGTVLRVDSGNGGTRLSVTVKLERTPPV